MVSDLTTRRLMLWDNGESCSEHQILFFNIAPYSDEFAKAVSPRLRHGDWAQPDGSLLGVGEVRWWEGYTLELRERVPLNIGADIESDEPEVFGWPALAEQWPEQVACLRAELEEHKATERARYSAMRGLRAQSCLDHLREEVDEAQEAIDSGDPEKLVDEDPALFFLATATARQTARLAGQRFSVVAQLKHEFNGQRYVLPCLREHDGKSTWVCQGSECGSCEHSADDLVYDLVCVEEGDSRRPLAAAAPAPAPADDMQPNNKDKDKDK